MSTFRDYSCKEIASINRLPWEILTMIFVFVGPSTFANPHIYLPLTWVCRSWRNIVIGNPIFWTTIYHKSISCGNASRNLIRELIRRSQSSKLDVLWCSCSDPPLPDFSWFSLHSFTQRFRIRTLNLQCNLNRFLDWPQPAFSFPQLENLIITTYDEPFFLGGPPLEVFKNLLVACRPRYVEFSARLFVQWSPELVESLSHLNWLKIISLDENVNIDVILRVLENLPNLRILNLALNPPRSFGRTVNLPNLRMLSRHITPDESHIIQTPPLDYLGISQNQDAYGDLEFCEDQTWRHVYDSIDWSMIKNVRVDFEKKKPYGGAGSIGCMSTGHSEEACDFFSDFHESVGLHHFSSVIPPRNSFHIELPWSCHPLHNLGASCIDAINIVDVTLDFCIGPTDRIEELGFPCFNDLKMLHDPSYCSGKDGFLNAFLGSVQPAIHLTTFRSPKFELICALLADTKHLPFLEQLTYHSLIPTDDSDETFLPLKTMQEARITASWPCKPLKVLELKNRVISSEEVARIEALGIEVIQS